MEGKLFFLLACAHVASGTELRHLSKGLKVFYDLINTDLLEADYLEIMKYLDLRFHRTCFNTHEEEYNGTDSVKELLTVVTAHDKEIKRLAKMIEDNGKRIADEMDRIRDECLRIENDSKSRDDEIQTLTVYDDKFHRKLCDVQAYEACQSGDCCIQETYSYTNMALGKPAWQSTDNYESSGKASGAVDGNRGDSSTWTPNTCFHTKIESRPWWMVDLGSMRNVGRVVLVNRADFVGERLQNVVISVSTDKDGHSEMCGFFPGPGHNGQVIEINCPSQIQGRYVKITMLSRNYLHLCEVEVYSH